MGFDPTEPEQRRGLRAALQALEITVGELWLNYFSIGGTVGEYEVEAYLQGLLSLPALQRDLLAMAANELIDAVPRLHAPYAKDLTESSRTTHNAQEALRTGNSEGAHDHRTREQEEG
ncbi:hypothetical protein PJ267_05260 [Arthrobacter sp. OVS8]|nr:hypothetical protein PJ267_05260 [Arthrobacter sp. OVS8]